MYKPSTLLPFFGGFMALLVFTKTKKLNFINSEVHSFGRKSVMAWGFFYTSDIEFWR